MEITGTLKDDLSHVYIFFFPGRDGHSGRAPLALLPAEMFSTREAHCEATPFPDVSSPMSHFYLH